MGDKQQMSIRILDMDYQVLTEDDQEQVERIAGYVDNRIREVRQSNASLTSLSAAVLTALNLTEELFRTRENLAEYKEATGEFDSPGEFRDKLEGAMSEISDSDAKAQSLLSQIADLQTENAELASLLEDYKDRFNALRSEFEANKRAFADLQNKLLENQIELIRTRKALLDYGEKV